eukprot:6721012-Pyramimonas_sp.AAC.1
MRVCTAAAARRAVVVREDDLLAKAGAQANPEIVSKALCTELNVGFANEFREERGGRDGTYHQVKPSASRLHGH